MYDAWTTLAAIAVRTKRLRIGALLTALTRRRPWKVAREAVTVDHLSNGRLIFPTGLGALDDGGYTKVGEPTSRRTRAELLDEGLEILTGLWSGKPFSYRGKHYRLEEMTFLPRPMQSPRIPIWVVAAWPRRKSMQRALRYDGLIPTKLNVDGSFAKMTPDDIREIKSFISKYRTEKTPFDIIWEGETPIGDPSKSKETVKSLAEAGATWWMESRWSPSKRGEVQARIKQGPPRI